MRGEKDPELTGAATERAPPHGGGWGTRLISLNPMIGTIGALTLATLLRVVFAPWWGENFAFITYYPAIMLSTVAGGWKYGLISTLCSTVFAFVTVFGLHPPERGQASAAVVFLGVNLAVIYLVETILRVRKTAEERALAAHERAEAARQELHWRQRAEETLHEHRERLRAIIETAVEGIVTIDEQGRIESANPAALRIFGYEAGELEGRDIGLLMPSPQREEHHHYIATYLRTGRRKVIGTGREVVGLRKDGKLFPMELSVAEFQVAERPRFTGFIRDITERKQAEARLRESEERRKLAQEAGRVGVFDVDMIAGTSTWSEEQEAIYGLAPGTFAGTTAAWKELVHPADLPRLETALARCAEERQAELEIDLRVVQPSGEIRWVASRSRMTYSAPGTLTRIIGASIDITDRKEAEAALRESEERFTTFMSNSPAAVFIKDADGAYAYANHVLAAILGTAAEQMRGQTDSRWLAPRYAEAIRLNDLEVLATQKPLHRVEVFPLAGRANSHWLACKFPLTDSRGRRFVGSVSVDVTATKRLEEEMLAVADREQQRIGHDLHDGLGQQLTALEMKCFLLLEDLAGENLDDRRPALQKEADGIGKGLRECIALTRSLARGLAPVKHNADGLMDALKELAHRTHTPGHVECRFSCPSPVFVGNAKTAGHLYRIAQEAVTNALKHAQMRQINIKLHADQTALSLQITDDGQGLTRPGQAGMGLEVMRHRATAIGGSLEVSSKPGRGVAVTCTVPKDRT